MKYFVTEVLEEDIKKGLQRNAGSKAREDVRDILLSEHAKEISIIVKEIERGNYPLIGKMKSHWSVMKKWKKILIQLGKNDVLYIQYPIRDHTIFGGRICKSLSKRGAKVVLLIHDLNILRENKKNIKIKRKIRLYLEELSMLKFSSYVIAHNEKMKNALIKLGISGEKIVSLEIFDYLTDSINKEDDANYKNVLEEAIVIAGNLGREKAGYLYQLPITVVNWNLYGINYSGVESNKIHYKGSYTPEELPRKLDGKFGLVWDGNSTDTCAGIYGKYLKINNPHKTSLYLGAELPVIIWKDAALAKFIKENKCGILINNLQEIDSVVENLSESEYKEIANNAKRISINLRAGFYTKKAIYNIDSMIKNGKKQ